jgi:hypothetical protein
MSGLWNVRSMEGLFANAGMRPNDILGLGGPGDFCPLQMSELAILLKARKFDSILGESSE